MCIWSISVQSINLTKIFTDYSAESVVNRGRLQTPDSSKFSLPTFSLFFILIFSRVLTQANSNKHKPKLSWLIVLKLLTAVIISEYIVNIYSLILTTMRTKAKNGIAHPRSVPTFLKERMEPSTAKQVLAEPSWSLFLLPSGCKWVIKNKENLMRPLMRPS